MKKNLFLLFSKLRVYFVYLSLFAFAIIFQFTSPSSSIAAEVTLLWDPSTNATGYNLYYGYESDSYDHVIDVGQNIGHTVSDLEDNQLYYFAVSAYNEHGESDLSEGISYTTDQNKSTITSEIIGTLDDGIWCWDVATSKGTRMSSGIPAGDIAAGDFTGDGKADVASIWASGLWYQDGDTLDWTKLPGGAPDKLTAGDVTGDDRSEIIGTWRSGIWYWDAAETSWTQMTSSVPDGDIAAGDFTGDGRADVASIWASGLWYQDGNTLDWTKVTRAVPYSMTAGDVTGDDRAEIVGTWNSGIWYWDVAESSWTQMTSSIPVGDIAAGDFTGDGKADVASIWSSGLWYQDGATLDWVTVSNSVPENLTAGDLVGE